MKSFLHDHDVFWEGKTEGREEGREQGQTLVLLNMISKKVKKEKPLSTIAEELEIEENEIKELYDLVVKSAPDYDVERILDVYLNRFNKD